MPDFFRVQILYTMEIRIKLLDFKFWAKQGGLACHTDICQIWAKKGGGLGLKLTDTYMGFFETGYYLGLLSLRHQDVLIILKEIFQIHPTAEFS